MSLRVDVSSAYQRSSPVKQLAKPSRWKVQEAEDNTQVDHKIVADAAGAITMMASWHDSMPGRPDLP